MLMCFEKLKPELFFLNLYFSKFQSGDFITQILTQTGPLLGKNPEVLIYKIR